MARLEEARTLVEKCRFITELEEGEEFEIYSERKKSAYNPHVLKDGYIYGRDGKQKSVLSDDIFKRLPWKPKDDEYCFIIDFFHEKGFYSFVFWEDNKEHQLAYRRGFIVKTEQEAKELVEKLDAKGVWWK